MTDKIRFDHILADINRGVNHAKSDISGRRKALKCLEEYSKSKIALYWSRMDRSLTREDVIPFANMLKSIGHVNNLDLIVVSPGGDGTAAETILHLCRKYCSNKFRVAIPAFAKSAATLIALGADEIIMGESSEIGPIDAQVLIMQDNNIQQVSAEHFLRAKDKAIDGLRSDEKHIVQASQIQLSLLSPAFIEYCYDSIQFAKDFANKQLKAHMFNTEYQTDQSLWEGRIDSITKNLTSSSTHLTHGRMITSQHIKSDNDLKHLKVLDLEDSDPYWLALNELLLRTEIIAQQMESGKILFAKNFELYGG